MGKLADALFEKSKFDNAIIVGSDIRAALGELESELKAANARERPAFMAGVESVLKSAPYAIIFDEEQSWQQHRDSLGSLNAKGKLTYTGKRSD